MFAHAFARTRTRSQIHLIIFYNQFVQLKWTQAPIEGMGFLSVIVHGQNYALSQVRRPNFMAEAETNQARVRTHIHTYSESMNDIGRLVLYLQIDKSFAKSWMRCLLPQTFALHQITLINAHNVCDCLH